MPSPPDFQRGARVGGVPVNDNRTPFRPRAPRRFPGKGPPGGGRPPARPPMPRLSKFIPFAGVVIGGAGVLDFYVDAPEFGGPLPNFQNPANWVLRHGPNTYLADSYVSQNHEPTVQRNNSFFYVSQPPYGPETGKITGQAISPSYRLAIGSYVPNSVDKVSYWIANDDYTRFAQYMAFQQATGQTYDNLINGGGTPVRDIDLSPKPRVAPDPFAGPDRFPMPAFPLPQVVYPMPRKPSVDEPHPFDKTGPQPKVGSPPAAPPGWKPDFHTPRPPRRDEKERKSKLRRGFDKVMNIFGEVTEIADIVDSAWEALLERCRTKTYYRGQVVTSAADRWADVYRCAPHMNIDQFIVNLINNHVQDWIIGTQNRLRNKVLPDGVNGIDIFRWLDVALFGGELSRMTDLSKFVHQLESPFKGSGSK